MLIPKRAESRSNPIPNTEKGHASVKLTNSKCECAGCGRFFTSTSSFEKHRRFIAGTDRRECLDPASVKLVDRDGYWGSPPMTEAQKIAAGFVRAA